MFIKLLMVVTAIISAANIAHCVEIEQIFPNDVTKFIGDRVPCDHFRSEPRDFDESYKREVGKKAELEEAKRATYLEKMTKKTCAQLDDRLRLLNRKYSSNKLVASKLAEYEYLEIGSCYVFIHKDLPDAKLIQEKLLAKGFMSYNVKLMDDVDWRGVNWNQPLPAQLTVQIGYLVDVFPAQLAIETLLAYGPKNLGVVVLAKDNAGLGLSMLVGNKMVGNYHVYTGDSIQDLLTPMLSREAFSEFAK